MSKQNPLRHSMLWLCGRMPELAPQMRALHAGEQAALAQRLDAAPEDVEAQALAALFDQLLRQQGGLALEWHDVPDEKLLPMICLSRGGALLLQAREPDGTWRVEGPDGHHSTAVLPAVALYGDLTRCVLAERIGTSAMAMVRQAIRNHRSRFVMAAVATVVINVLALLTSLYSMQVYDRVIPSQGLATLYALTTGVLLAQLLDLAAKFTRSSLMDKAIRGIDLHMSHNIFERLLRTRMDQFPPSVGTLSSQLRSYESIRGFAMSAALYLLVDVPFAAVFMLAILWLGGPLVALVPLVFFVLAIATGMLQRRRIEQHARSSMAASNRKLGLLVETVSNAEGIKANGSGWQMLSRWNRLSSVNVDEDMQVRHMSEAAGYYAGLFQQASYVMLVAVGAYVAATSSELTSGGVIACSILSGKVLNPIGQLPGLLVQWAHAKGALGGLERMMTLEQDNQDIAHPLVPTRLCGALKVEEVTFHYPESKQGIELAKLEIGTGQKVGILGAAGSGKSTLLKLMSGMYRPQKGRVFLDKMDLQHIARSQLSRRMGYLAQDVRLMGGTLRDNLLSGLIGVSEAQMIAACECTGLDALVAGNAKGFELPIAEGGSGVSGGQKQLIALTRLILSNPDMWLLDEPTASMDEAMEARVLSILAAAIQPEQTLVLVTHKPALLALVDRLIVLTPEGIALDGPKEQVLQRLQQGYSVGRPPTRAVQVQVGSAA